MEFALVLRELARRRRMVAIGVLVAAIVAVLSVYRLEGLELKPRSLQHSSASTQVLVDSQPSVLGNVSQSFEPLTARAGVYANFMTSPVVLNLIGQQVGLSGEQIYAAGPVSANEPRVEQEPTALRRNVEITGETKPYRLNFETQANLPTISINSQAPTTKQAVALANAAAVGMQRYVAGIETANRIPPSSRVAIHQLGPASGAVADAGIRKSLAAMTFVAVFLVWCVLVLVVSRFRETWRASAALQVAVEDASRGANDGEGSGDASEAAPRDIPADVPSSPLFDVPSLRDDDHGPAVPARSMR
jgi:hypothetical protein